MEQLVAAFLARPRWRSSLAVRYRERRCEALGALRDAIHAPGNVHGLGIYEDAWVYPWYYPSVSAYGYYNHTWDPNTGHDQTDVTLVCFRADKSRYWSSVYGSGFDHVSDNFDESFRPWGCDFGGDLALYNGEALYWVGTTGSNLHPWACPYPGTSYCEDQNSYATGGGDWLNGFMARMNLVGLNIGVQEGTAAAGPSLIVLPNPAHDAISIVCNTALPPGARLQVVDALGKQVLAQTIHTNRPVPIGALSAGLYLAVVLNSDGHTWATARFLKR